MDWPPGRCQWLPLLLIAFVRFVSPDGGKIPVGGIESSDDQGPVFIHHILPLQDYYPFNVTINHLTPRSVEVSWNCKGQNLNDKFEVTLRPLEASYRVIEAVPYNTCYLIMNKLEPNTNYQVQVSSISGRIRKRSNSVIFRTYLEDFDLDYMEITEEEEVTPEPKDVQPNNNKGPSPGEKDRLRLPRVRLVEISLVGMALILWAGAIVLFFHRWGKIRMLLPYQPDYKEMKRSNSVCVNCSMTPHHQFCRLHQLPYGGEYVQVIPKPELVSASASVGCVPVTDTGCSPIRPRFNSFIVYDVNECRKEHPLGECRKAKSAENLEHYTPFIDDTSDSTEIAADVDCTDF